MTFAPLFAAGPVITVHALLALVAIGLGGAQLLMPKGTPLHRGLGRLWVGLMAAVALSSFFITEFRIFGPFSPIHLLSAYALWAIWQGVRAARKGDIAQHRQTMQLLFLLALIVTGAFTLLPGRRMHAVLFGA